MSNKQTIEVSAAVILKDGYILAAQKGYGEFKGKWEFPGGKVKDGELYQDTVIREIKEELKADINVDDYLTTIYYEYPNFNLIMHTFLCSLKSDIHFTYHNESELEHDNLVWLEKDDLDHIDWLPADIEIVNVFKQMGRGRV